MTETDRDRSVTGRPRRAHIVIASTRAAAGVYPDRTGPVISAWLGEHGFEADTPEIVADGPPVGEALRAALAGHPSLIVTSGGTGLGHGDVTPEFTRALIEREIPGFAEELRRRGAVVTPTALLSRGVAGVSGRTVIVNLPGSAGGVRDGLGLLGEVIDHLLDQLDGGDHG